ncbi:MAG: hypothetical protein ACREPN_12710 [Rudaea sp.]
MNSNEPFERDFERFVGNDDSPLAALYRKLPQPEPDAQLDAAVRAMAYRVVAKTAQAPTRRHRWLPVLATAATLVLAAGIAIRMGPHTGTTRQSIPAAARDEGTPARDTMQPASPPVSNAPVAAPAPALQSLRATAAPKLAPTSPEPTAQTRAPLASEPTGSSAAKVENSAPNALRVRAPQTFPASAVQQQKAQLKGEAEALAAGRPAEEQNTATAGARARSAAAPAYSTELIRNSRLYPESWIAAIRRLIQTGRDEEAKQNLDYFRKKYPHYQLPADLEQFIEQSR